MKLILILFLGVFILSSVYGQDNKRLNFQFDLGSTVSIPFKKTEEYNFEYNGQIISTRKSNYSLGFGYFAELMTSYNFDSKLSLLIGTNYYNISFKNDCKSGLIENKGVITTSYIHFPLLIKYRIIEKIPISVSFGPYLRILTGAKEKGTTYLDTANIIVLEPNDPSLQPEVNYNNEVKENYSTIDYGLSLQFDFEVSLSTQLTGVILTRFNYGMKNVINNQYPSINIPEKWNNYSFDIGIGIKI